MTRADNLNLNADPVRTEMTSMQQIPIPQVFSTDESESKGIIADKNLSQVCSTDESEPERVIINESSTEERKLKAFTKISTQTKKYMQFMKYRMNNLRLQIIQS